MAAHGNTVSEQDGKADHHTIQIGDPDDQLIATINEQLKTLSPIPTQRSIHRVPDTLRRVNEEAFVPRLLSIGPLHRGKEHLQDIEGHKWQYLNSLLQQKPQTSLRDYVKAMRELEERTRKCYAETIDLSSDDFVKMMLLDGCFIIELLLKNKKIERRDNDDPIFNVYMMLSDIHRDIILLENQLPFFVLKRLFDLIENSSQEGSVTSILELIRFFFSKFLDKGEPEFMRRTTSEPQHLLDLLRTWLIPSSRRKSMKDRGRFELIRSVTELHEAGVKFKVGTGSCLMDIKFMNGVLEIPPLTIADSTDSLLRNLIAYEQCCNRCTPCYITDYAILMEYLINTPRDVGLLDRHGIIENLLGDNEEVSCLFKKLGKEVVFNSGKFYFSNICLEVNAYHRARWHVWQATLRRDYFKNPWAILSFIAAILLLIFTFIQTVSSVRSLMK